MCRVYNTIGSLTTLKLQLVKNGINDFKSLKEVIAFQRDYPAIRAGLLSGHEKLIAQEKELLGVALSELGSRIDLERREAEQRLKDVIEMMRRDLDAWRARSRAGFLGRLIWGFKIWSYKRRIAHREGNLDLDVARSIDVLLEDYGVKERRYFFLKANNREAVMLSAQRELSELDRKKMVVDGLSSFIYGALGEQMVVKALEVLTDEYHLLNDFSVTVSPAIYSKQTNEYIQSIQIDHILVGPSGVFLIETKNWSGKSVDNSSLRSPVLQVQRSGLVMFKLFNKVIEENQLRLNSHHWGDKKVSIRNLIVLTSAKPEGEFQYVKVLTVDELPAYIKYFKRTLSDEEVKRIVELLQDIKAIGRIAG